MSSALSSDTQWHLARDGKLLGTFSLLRLQERARSAQLQPTDQIVRVGYSEWQQVASVTALLTPAFPIVSDAEESTAGTLLSRTPQHFERSICPSRSSNPQLSLSTPFLTVSE